MKQIPSPEEINRRRDELRLRIAIGKQAEKELAELETSIEKLAEIFATNPLHPSPTNPSIPTQTFARPKLTDLAEQALRDYPKLHIKDLIYLLQRLGWGGSGDADNDKKNLYNTLSNSKRFKKVGRNVWAIADNAPSEAPDNDGPEQEDGPESPW